MKSEGGNRRLLEVHKLLFCGQCDDHFTGHCQENNPRNIQQEKVMRHTYIVPKRTVKHKMITKKTIRGITERKIRQHQCKYTKQTNQRIDTKHKATKQIHKHSQLKEYDAKASQLIFACTFFFFVYRLRVLVPNLNQNDK